MVAAAFEVVEDLAPPFVIGDVVADDVVASRGHGMESLGKVKGFRSGPLAS